MAAHMEPDHPGMHTTATVDYEFVVSGSIVLELDDGTEVELHPGDTVVQNGTRHAWRNQGSEPCQMVVVLIGAHHAPHCWMMSRPDLGAWWPCRDIIFPRGAKWESGPRRR